MRVPVFLLGVALAAGCGAATGREASARPSPEASSSTEPETPGRAVAERCRVERWQLDVGEPRRERVQRYALDDEGRVLSRVTVGGDGERDVVRYEHHEDGSATLFHGHPSPLEPTQRTETRIEGAQRAVTLYEATGESGGWTVRSTRLYRYDDEGRITRVTRAEDDLEEGVRCEYDDHGRLVRAVGEEHGEEAVHLGYATFHYGNDGHLARIERGNAEEDWRDLVERDGDTITVTSTPADRDAEDPFEGPPSTRVVYTGACRELVAGECAPRFAPAPAEGERYELPL